VGPRRRPNRARRHRRGCSSGRRGVEELRAQGPLQRLCRDLHLNRAAIRAPPIPSNQNNTTQRSKISLFLKDNANAPFYAVSGAEPKAADLRLHERRENLQRYSAPYLHRGIIGAVSLEIAAVAVASPGEVTVTTTAPAWPRLLCTIAMQSPLKALRSDARSGSWQLGSPLPTPITLPGPATVHVTLLFASGTSRPCASTIATLITARSCPSALIFGRSAVTRILAAGQPSRACRSARSFRPCWRAPPVRPAVLHLPHQVPVFFTGCEPRLAPLRNSSTLSWLQ